MRARPIGVLMMEDESGMDEKILAVPHHKLSPLYDKVKEYGDVPDPQIMRIQHFFEHYKDLEPNKWVKVTGWGDSEKARQLILESIERAKTGA